MLEHLKRQVLECALAAEADGLCKRRAGNFSVCDRASGYICITPSGADRAKLRCQDICVIDMDMRVVEMTDGFKPTSEALMHVNAYKARPDITAVVHTHSKFATVFAVLGRPIPPVVYEVAQLGCKDGLVRVAPYGRPGTRRLADNVAATLCYGDVLLMESHGALAVAADGLAEALLKAQYVEELAEIYYRVLQLNGGQEPPVVAAEELAGWRYPAAIKLDGTGTNK